MERLVLPVLTLSAAEVLAPLAARPDLEVVAVVVDTGSGESLEGLRDRALVAGARRCHVVDKVDALAGSVCWPVLRAGSPWTVEAPAALALQVAFDALTADRFDAPTREMADTVAESSAAVVRDGTWFSPVRAGLDAFVDRVLDPVTGEVRLRVVAGRIEVDV
jgi:argininosuccinate synthase